MQGFLEHRIQVIAAGHLNPYWLARTQQRDTQVYSESDPKSSGSQTTSE